MRLKNMNWDIDASPECSDRCTLSLSVFHLCALISWHAIPNISEKLIINDFPKIGRINWEKFREIHLISRNFVQTLW